MAFNVPALTMTVFVFRPVCVSVHACVCVSNNSNEGSLRDYHSWAFADLKVK